MVVKRRILYILQVLALVVIGGGVCLPAKSSPGIDIPEGNPVREDK